MYFWSFSGRFGVKCCFLVTVLCLFVYLYRHFVVFLVLLCPFIFILWLFCFSLCWLCVSLWSFLCFLTDLESHVWYQTSLCDHETSEWHKASLCQLDKQQQRYTTLPAERTTLSPLFCVISWWTAGLILADAFRKEQNHWTRWSERLTGSWKQQQVCFEAKTFQSFPLVVTLQSFQGCRLRLAAINNHID